MAPSGDGDNSSTDELPEVPDGPSVDSDSESALAARGSLGIANPSADGVLTSGCTSEEAKKVRASSTADSGGKTLDKDAGAASLLFSPSAVALSSLEAA